MYIIAYITAFVKRNVQFHVHDFAKTLEKSCQVWYNITAQKLIDNKHPPIIGKIAGCVEREKMWQKVHKNSLIINAAAYRYYPFVLFLSLR